MSTLPIPAHTMNPRVTWQLITLICLIALIFLLLLLEKERKYFSFVVDNLVEEDERYSRRLLGNEEPLIFVGGMPRSGTTLMRAMLDAHEDIRCGEETLVVPVLLFQREKWIEKTGLITGSGLTLKVIDDAVSAFIIEVIAKHGPMAPRLCDKDPFALHHTTYLKELFPNSKYILMLRDARATVHSIISRDVPIGGFNRSDPLQCFSEWSKNIEKMVSKCRMVEDCLMVHYESLVLSPREQMARILSFLDAKWSERVLEHEKYVGEEVRLNPHEFSTSQVVHEVNKGALSTWVGFFDEEVLDKVSRAAPMMASLGYDPKDINPNYEKWILKD